MRPVLFEAPWGPVHAYGTAILLGMVAAFPGVRWDAKQRGLSLAFVLDLYLAVFIGGFVGGKLPLLVDTDLVPRGADPWGGFVFYGSALGAASALAWVARRHQAPLVVVISLALTWIAVCQLFGRLGCFLAGCCYGAAWTSDFASRWAVTFPANSIAYTDLQARGSTPISDHTPLLHAVQLYEVVGLGVVFAIVLFVRRRRGPRADLGPAYTWAIVYGAVRLITDVFRAPSDRGYVAQWPWSDVASLLSLPPDHALMLSGSQAVSLVLIVAGAVGWRRLHRRPRSATLSVSAH